MLGAYKNVKHRNPNRHDRCRNHSSKDCIELVMTEPIRITAEYSSVWRYKTIPDAKYRFLYQIGRTVHYSPLIDDNKYFTIDVSNWIEHYVQIDN